MAPRNDFAKLAERLQKAPSFYTASAARILKGMFRHHARELIENTAVDTGETRSNWRASHTPTTRGVREPYVKYPQNREVEIERRIALAQLRLRETANAEAAMLAVDAFLSGLTSKEIAGGKPIFISNPSKLAKWLNDGDGKLTPLAQGADAVGYIERAQVSARAWLLSQPEFKGFKDFG